MEEIDRLALKLRPHYGHFLRHREGEVLLTAHSHQAWPDVAREGQLAAWDDAARLVDGKWDRIFSEILPEVQARIAERLGSSRRADLAVAASTHELVYRLLSCWPENARVLTTDSEFHSLSRQLARSEEEGLSVRRVPAEPGANFAARFIHSMVQHEPDLVALSHVFFTTGRIVTRLGDVLEAAAARDVPVLVDTYHSFCALPLEADEWPGRVFVTGGGYKYAQCGEGVCFLLLPRDAERFRPRNTGWMADFGALERTSQEIRYGAGALRFFGATFEPTSLYRALHVLRWMDKLGLTPEVLRAASLLRTGRLLDRYDDLRLAGRGLGLATPRAESERGGFVAFRHARAVELSRALRARGIHTDARGDLLRLGPAPYTTSGELDRAMTVLADLL